VVIDVDAGRFPSFVRLLHGGAVAPRQELRIELDAIDKLEHRVGGERHEHRLPYALHDVVARMRDARERDAVRELSGDMSIVDNKKAYHDYFIEEKFEAGVALEGWEVKAIRAGRAQIKEAYVVVKSGEIVLIGAHITPLVSASTHVTADPTRTRKLLLHRKEINRLVGQVERAGYTLVPLNLHFSKGKIKLDVGLAKGKKQYDKRATVKEREWNREQQRLMRNRTGGARIARGS
jgi:SsrA-binding protein